MIDISPVSFLSPSNTDVTDSKSTDASRHRASIGELFALCMAQISKAPSLRDVARTHLSQRLKGVVATPNPDIFFINTRAMDGSISRSLSLTDALLQALIHGVSSLDDGPVDIYVHHDSVHEAHRVLNLSLAETLRVFGELVLSLPSAYKDLLDDFWAKNPQKFLGLPGFLHGVTDTHHGVVSDLQAMALYHEVELNLAEGVYTAEEEDRLSDVIHDVSLSGIYTLSLGLPDGLSAPLTSVFVITQMSQTVDPLSSENSSGTVFLLTPARGFEKFDSLTLLEGTLIERLANVEEREPLLQDLLYRDRALLVENDAALSGLRPGYSALDRRLLHSRTLNLRHKQIQDFEFTLTRARQNKEDVSTFLQKVGDIQYLKSFDTALQRQFITFSNHEQQKAMPHWLKYAPQAEKASYLALQAECLRREQALSQLLVGLESLETYAQSEIDEYVRQHLGYSVDPAQLFITFSDKSQLWIGDFHAPLRKSLLAFAIDGLPARGGLLAPDLEIPEDSCHPAWNVEFVETMFAELDVRHRYAQALRARYRDPKTHKAMVHLGNSTLALSALAAKLQSIITDDDLELITLLREGTTKVGAQLTIGGVMLGVTGTLLNDLVVFHERNETGEHYVLYAPGAPEGRDMFSFDSWHKVSWTIGGWLKTSAGVCYLADRTPADLREKAASFLLSIQEKPTQWQEQSVIFARLPQTLKTEDFWRRSVDKKVEDYLADVATAAPFDDNAGSYGDRRTLAALDAQIAAVEAAYASVTPLKSYREYARDEGKRLLTLYLARQGVHQAVDPETVYVDLEKDAHHSVPDFSEYTSLQPLTRFFMQGRSSHNAFHEAAALHSSVGQDLSVLPSHVITDALKHEVGETYIALLKTNLLNPQDVRYARRRTLYATRLELQMRRAALIELMHGRLDPDQYRWLNHLILGVSKSGPADEAPSPELIDSSSMSTLHFKRLPVEGVFRFKDFKGMLPAYDLIYTPNAPDGVLFREAQSIARSMQSPGMAEYYYGRVRYQDQPHVIAMIDAINQTSDIRDPLPIVDNLLVGTEIAPTDRIADLETLYVEMLERMITDVDNQSVSGMEVLADRIYTAMKWIGTILLIPFPPAALAWSYLHTMIDFARGVVAYATGDRATATTFFAWGMFGMWFGLSGVDNGFKNQPSLLWKAILSAKGRVGKYTVRSF